MRLLLVRHGETTGNLAHQLQDEHDPLTDQGRQQARALAAALAQRGDLGSLYSSPFARAFETAQIIGAATGLTPQPRPALAEINVGQAAGLTFAQWAECFPDQLAAFQQDGVAFTWPGGESGAIFAARIVAELDNLITQHLDDAQAVVLVSHGGALAWAISYLLREPGDQWPNAHMGIGNCAVSEVTIDPAAWIAGQPATFLRRNDQAHLAHGESPT